MGISRHIRANEVKIPILGSITKLCCFKQGFFFVIIVSRPLESVFGDFRGAKEWTSAYIPGSVARFHSRPCTE